MKIRNILIAGLSLLAVVGCSKDDNDGNGNSNNPSEMKSASLNITVKASGPTSTKADDDDPNALEGEKNINNIQVITFSNDGSQKLADPFSSTSVSSVGGEITVTGIPTKATKAMIAIVANAPVGIFSDVTSYTEFKTKLAQLSDQKQTNLTMSAQIITATASLTSGENYLGYSGQTNINNISTPIELTRLAARIELVSATTNFATKASLDGRTVRINSIQIVNQKTASLFASTMYWGPVLVADNYSDADVNAFTDLTFNANNPLATTVYRHYVMENTDLNNPLFDSTKPTQVIVSATLLATSDYQAETKSFVATINPNGLLQPWKHNYVKRNYIYRLGFTFGPNSFTGIPNTEPIVPPTPPEPPIPAETGDLDVQVQVVGWGPVNQNLVIE